MKLHKDIFDYFLNMSYMPRWGVLMLDIVLCLIAFALSYFIGFQLIGYKPNEMSLTIWQQAGLILMVQAFFFMVFHTYAGILRYSTFSDIIRIGLAVLCTGGAILAINFCITPIYKQLFLNSLIIIYIFISLVLLFTWRVTIKTSFEYMSHVGNRTKKVLVYGVQSAGISIAKMLKSDIDSLYRPVGFIADATDDMNHDLLSLPVYVRNEKLIPMMQAHNIRYIIISPMKLKQLNPLTDLHLFIDNGISVLTTPHFTDVGQENASDTPDSNMSRRIGAIESIRVEDLLERPTIQINTDHVGEVLHRKVVLVTGAAGSIGQEIVRQVLRFKPTAVILFEQAESPLHDLKMDLRNLYPNSSVIAVVGDIRQKERLEEVMREYRPDVVFHAAAYKHVPLMEEYPNEAVIANVLGTKNVADLSVQYGVKRFIMISTDKAVNPTNVMGASKRIAEIYVQSLFRKLQQGQTDCTKFITTRFGNVLGSNGSVIPYFKKQIASGGPVTVTHPDITRFFMTIPEACTLVLEAATLGNGGEIFVFDMGTPVRIYDLAKNMIRLAGYKPGEDIMITFTGLRPGEKLYEEVLNQKETTLPTSNKKIMIAKVRESDYETVSGQIDQLIATARSGKPMRTVQEMKQIVPEYKSKNSIYEQLD